MKTIAFTDVTEIHWPIEKHFRNQTSEGDDEICEIAGISSEMTS